jgi:AcrR family transcriptional regulator
VTPGGLRERNKRDKHDRIVAAARRLFRRQGFERTTTYQVAADAGIGTGTLFLYARTKEDLLVMVFLLELSRVVDESFASLDRKAPLIEQLLHLYDAVAEHHAHNLALGRPFAKELMFVHEGRRPEMRAFMAGWMRRIAGMIEDAKGRGEIDAGADTRLIATSSFAQFFFRLQSWLGGYITRPRLDSELRESIVLMLDGAAPQRAPSRRRHKTTIKRTNKRQGGEHAGTHGQATAGRAKGRSRGLDRG